MILVMIFIHEIWGFQPLKFLEFQTYGDSACAEVATPQDEVTTAVRDRQVAS